MQALEACTVDKLAITSLVFYVSVSEDEAIHDEAATAAIMQVIISMF